MYYLFIVLLSLFSFKKTKTDVMKPSYTSKVFTLQKATKIAWRSGAPNGEGGAGIDYEFTIHFTKTYNGYLKMLWVDKKYFALKQRNGEPIPTQIAAGTTITVYATEMTSYPPSGRIPVQKNTTDPPYPYKGVAMIEYEYKNKTYCIVVREWNEEKKVNGQ